MRIAFPTRDEQTITGHFGRMKAFVIIDVEDGAEFAREIRDMPGLPACSQGHGDKPKYITDKLADCNVLITGGMGEPMYDNITNAGVQVVLTRIRPIADALDQFLAGTLENERQLAHKH